MEGLNGKLIDMDMMEGVRPEEITEKDMEWCTVHWTILVASVLGGMLEKSDMDIDNPNNVGAYTKALIERLSEFGIEAEAYKGLDWDAVNSIKLKA